MTHLCLCVPESGNDADDATDAGDYMPTNDEEDDDDVDKLIMVVNNVDDDNGCDSQWLVNDYGAWPAGRHYQKKQ